MRVHATSHHVMVNMLARQTRRPPPNLRSCVTTTRPASGSTGARPKPRQQRPRKRMRYPGLASSLGTHALHGIGFADRCDAVCPSDCAYTPRDWFLAHRTEQRQSFLVSLAQHVNVSDEVNMLTCKLSLQMVRGVRLIVNNCCFNSFFSTKSIVLTEPSSMRTASSYVMIVSKQGSLNLR